MFFSNHHPTRMTCGFKVSTNSPGWHKSMAKILKKIKGGDFAIDVEEGVAYVSGEGDIEKLLKLMGSNTDKGTEMAFVKTGSWLEPCDPNFYGSNYGYFSHGLPLSGYWQPNMAYPTTYPCHHHHHHHHTYSGHCNCGYYYY
ncbi:PREDICTED: uncharacterized protein LOC104820146 [Tarenaya hassleriana]|uniref:uncharacterized protein LOC104820146 n=1 Tax=Tarenaya hassleriana TaxID=28532 RepID=UPI00053C830A|nr:PREDICTED: uncharacterized protein LOC104820146 [Tarenaya hassleriana]